MLERLFPRPVDNRYEGYKAALWLLGLDGGDVFGVDLMNVSYDKLR